MLHPLYTKLVVFFLCEYRNMFYILQLRWQHELQPAVTCAGMETGDTSCTSGTTENTVNHKHAFHCIYQYIYNRDQLIWQIEEFLY